MQQQKEELVSLKELASKEDLSEETLRKELERGQIKGEKKGSWFKEEWYISSEEIDRLRLNPDFRTQRRKLKEERDAKRAARKVDPSLSNTTITSLLGPDAKDGESQAKKPWQGEYRQRVKTIAEELVRPLLERLEMQAVLLEEKERFIAEQSTYLRLIPDFKRQAEAHRTAIENKDKEARELHERLKESQEKAHETEVQLNQVEQELATFRSQKEMELTELLGQLETIQGELTKLRKPVWKRIFRPQE